MTIENYLKKLQKDFDNIVIAASDSNYTLVPYYIPSGNLVYNWILSNDFFGGYPSGRVIEISGEPGQSKSTIGFTFLANIQKMGGIAILDDSEKAYLKAYGELLGIDNNKLIYTSSRTVEETRDKILKYIEVFKDRKDKIPIGILVDSIGRLTTEHEIDSVDKVDYSKSKQLNKLVRVCSGPCEEHGITIVMLNHVYTNMGGYITTQETPGGRGIKYLSAVRLSVRKKPIIDERKLQIGMTVFMNCIKNNISPEGRKGSFEIYNKNGIDKYSGLFDLLKQLCVIEKVAGSYSFRFTTVADEVRFKRNDPEAFHKLIEEKPELLKVEY